MDVAINKKSRFGSIKDLLFHEKQGPEVFVLSVVSNNNVTNTVFKNYKLAHYEFAHTLGSYGASMYLDTDLSKEAISSDGIKIQLRKTSLIGG